MEGLGAPGEPQIDSALEDPLPSPWSRSSLASDWGRRGTKSWQHPVLETLVTMETGSQDCSVNTERAQLLRRDQGNLITGPSCPLAWMGLGGGGHRVTGLPHHPIPVPTGCYPIPRGAQPGGSCSTGLMLAQPSQRGSLGGKGIGEGAGFRWAWELLTSACLRSRLKNHQGQIGSTLEAQLLEKQPFGTFHYCHHYP